MVSDKKTDKKKINRVISFLKKGLESLSDELEGTVKGINDFLNSLNKAQKDLIENPAEEEVITESTSSAKIATAPVVAKTVAASTLFNLLSGTTGGASKASAVAAPTLSASPSGAPKPSGGGPPKAPTAGSPKPPSAPDASSHAIPPSAGPPSRGGNLPPAPKLPPTPGSGGAPKPPGAGAAFAKRPPGAPSGGSSISEPPGVPSAPPSAPSRGGIPAVAPAPATATATGGGLSSLRDEMLTELTRLKKIMRGE